MSDDIKRMGIKEFQRLGFLQEANRLFFHPLGLALEVTIEPDDGGPARISGVWDYRDDPEGIVFGGGVIDAEKVLTVKDEYLRHVDARVAMFGAIVQPVDET
jgi:hypothetical protein